MPAPWRIKAKFKFYQERILIIERGNGKVHRRQILFYLDYKRRLKLLQLYNYNGPLYLQGEYFKCHKNSFRLYAPPRALFRHPVPDCLGFLPCMKRIFKHSPSWRKDIGIIELLTKNPTAFDLSPPPKTIINEIYLSRVDWLVSK